MGRHPSPIRRKIPKTYAKLYEINTSTAKSSLKILKYRSFEEANEIRVIRSGDIVMLQNPEFGQSLCGDLLGDKYRKLNNKHLLYFEEENKYDGIINTGSLFEIECI